MNNKVESINMPHKLAFKIKFSDVKKIDKTFLYAILIILFFGFLMVYDASVFYADQNFGLKYHFLILQLGWIFIGLTVAFIVSIIDLSFFKDKANFFFIASVVLLIFVLLPTS